MIINKIPNFTHADPSETLSPKAYRYMIEQQLMDDLDTLSVEFIKSFPPQTINALDLGGRKGMHAKRMSIAGASVTMIDLIDLPHNHFTSFGHDGILFPLVTHLQKNFKDINENDIPKTLDMIYSQRALNYLNYHDTKKLLTFLYERLEGHGAIFLSLAGHDTEYGLTHKARANPIETRFDYLGNDMQEKHNIRQKICIYRQEELVELLHQIGFTHISSMQSGFGNVKAIAYKQKPIACAPLEF